jgi:ACS family hexuronate transporter-like MFS transporter
MDRLTLNLTAARIMDDFELDEQGYGRVESAFALAFACGALVTGWMVDRWNVFWIYPLAVLAWSAAGFCTGLATSFAALVGFRFCLGLAEAANWPCALRTTQRLLSPAERSLGNGILQSGAAIGAIVTPLVVLALVPRFNTWRYPFFVVGAVGILWAILWLASVRRQDLELSRLPRAERPADGSTNDSAMDILLDRRFWVLIVLVISINTAWHYFRAWLPLFLQKQHGYSEQATGWFTMSYYIATDAGSLCAGYLALLLSRHGFTVHRSRLIVFSMGSGLTALSLVAATRAAGPLLLSVLLLIGFGALGMFPIYYSLSQELTVRHQGKLTGALGCINWLGMALLHALVGDSIKQTGSYSQGVALAGLAPVLGACALFFLWPSPQSVNEKRLSKDLNEAEGSELSQPVAVTPQR